MTRNACLVFRPAQRNPHTVIHFIFGIALAAIAVCGGASIAGDPRYSIGTRLLMGTITALSMALIALIGAGFTWLVMGGLLDR